MTDSTYAQLMSTASQIQAKATQVSLDEADQNAQMGARDDAPPVSDAQKQAIRQQYADIPSLFQPFANLPDPQDYQSGITTLDRIIMKNICASDTRPADQLTLGHSANFAISGLGSAASGRLSAWKGNAATNFKTNFLGQFSMRAENLFVLAGVVKGGLQAEQSMWTQARANITHIATGTLDALDNIGTCSQGDWVVGLTVASSIAQILAAIESEGGSLALTAVGAATQVGAAVPGTPSQPGGNAEQIIAAMRQLISQFGQQLTSTLNLITSRLQASSGQVEQNLASFDMPRPAMDNMDDKTLVTPTGLGHP